MSEPICRKATTKDLAGVVALQNLNLVSNLSEDQKKDGFLSGAFSEEQFAEMNQDVGILVSVDDDKVAGFICVGSVEFNLPYPLPKAMIEEFSRIQFDRKSLSTYECVIAGPVCVAREKRGTGLFDFMYGQVYKILPAHINMITTLVSKSNPRSLKAHEKVGMQIVGDFHYQGRDFVIMVRPVHQVSATS